MDLLFLKRINLTLKLNFGSEQSHNSGFGSMFWFVSNLNKRCLSWDGRETHICLTSCLLVVSCEGARRQGQGRRRGTQRSSETSHFCSWMWCPTTNIEKKKLPADHWSSRAAGSAKWVLILKPNGFPNISKLLVTQSIFPPFQQLFSMLIFFQEN